MGLKILDCYGGTGSATREFALRGHDVVIVEIDANLIDNDLRHRPNVHILEMDMLKFGIKPGHFLPEGWRPDYVWLSPPCQCFSLGGSAQGKRIWLPMDPPHSYYGPRFPKTVKSKRACGMVLAGLRTVEVLKPRWWIMENPRGGLRTMGFMRAVPWLTTVTYCQYGENRMKATDLWGIMPDSWQPFMACKNRMKCHESAPRGAKTGTQGLRDSRDRGRIPQAFVKEIADCLESETIVDFTA